MITSEQQNILYLMTNLLLTEREGRTGEYWPEVVTVRAEHRKVRKKNDQGPIFPCTARPRLVSK